MCDFQSLYVRAYGYVLYCPSCLTYQVGFLSTCMSFSAAAFTDLQRTVARKIRTDYYYTEAGIRQIWLPAPCPGAQLFLTRGELLLLYHMLDAADSEALALRLIGLFNV